MFSDVAFRGGYKEILTNLNTDPKKPLGFVGLPGGKAKDEELPEIGGPREFFQETNQDGRATKYIVAIPKTNPDGDYYIHYFILIKIISERELKNHEEPSAIPQWIPVEEIISGRVKMFRSHVQGLIMLLEKMAEGKSVQGRVDRNRIPILLERSHQVAELLDELKKVFDEKGGYVRKFVPQRLIRAGYRPFDN